MPVEKKGRLIYIEPTDIGDNGVNGYPSPLEDNYIYVDLEIIKNDRYACGQPNATGKGSIRHFRAVDGNKSFFKGTNGMLTTNFTEVNPVDPDKSTDECIGIKSINIDYTSWQCPQATIVFTDVRGSSLMGKNEGYANGTATKPSFFNDMFMMPYPIFRLTVKGFYGNAVTYNLSLKDTSIALDSSTGNFDITASFVGYMYGPLADIPMSLLVVAPYVNYDGKNIWEDLVASGHFSFINDQNKNVPMIRFPEFRLKLAQLASNEKYLKSQNERNDRIDELNKRKNQIEELINEYPFTRWNEPKDDSFLFTIKTGDLDASEKGSSTSVKNLSKKISEYWEKLKKYDSRYQTNFSTVYSCLEKGDRLKCAYNYLLGGRKRVFGHSVTDVADGSDHSYSIMDNYLKNDDVKKALNSIESEISISKYRFYTYDKNNKDFFDSANILKDELAKIEESFDKIEEEYQDTANQVATEFFGFPLTIRNIYNMVFAHFETFARLVYGVTKKISSDLNNNSEVRDPSYYGISLTDTDISWTLGNPYMPPFTAIYSKKDEEGQAKNELLWLGELTKGNDLDEVGLVNAIVDAARLYTTREYQIQKLIESSEGENGVSINGDITEFIPLTYYDFANFGHIDNPYYKSASVGKDGSSIDPQMLTIFALRCYYYLLGNDGEEVKEGRAFGILEALNVYKAFGNTINASFRNFYKKYIEQCSYGDFWYFLKKVDSWNFLKTPVIDNMQYTWYKKDGDKVIPVGEYSLSKLQSMFNNDPEKNPNKDFINLSHLEKNKGNFYIFQSKDYVRDIVDNLSKTNFGEFDEDFEVYKKENVIRNLANNMDGKSKVSMWSNTATYNLRSVILKNDENYTNGFDIGTVELMKRVREQDKNIYFRFPTCYGEARKVDEQLKHSLFGNPFYWLQKDIKAKAYLFLFSIPYMRDLISPKCKNGTDFLITILMEGAVYWREEDDKIETEGYVEFGYGNKQVKGDFKYKKAKLNEIYLKRNTTTYAIPYSKNENYASYREPQGTNKTRKEFLKNYFINWAENEYSKIDVLLRDPDVYFFDDITVKNNEIAGLVLNYVKGFGGGIDKASIKCERLQSLLRETLLGLRTVIDTTDGITQNKPVWHQTFQAAFNGFCDELKKIYENQIVNDEVPVNSKTIIEDAFKNKDIRLSTYMVLKNLYDRWFCSTELDKWILNAEHNESNLNEYNDQSSYFDKFIYIDSFYHDIGDRILVNGNKVLDLISKSIPSSDNMKEEPDSTYKGMSMYKYLTGVSMACNGQLLSLPMFYGLNNEDALEDIFKALPLSRTTMSDTSAFVFLYSYQPSQHLDLGHGYRYDGIDLTDEEDLLPMAFRDGETGRSNIIPAFGVTFAKQNQSFFKNISLNTNQPKTSEIGLFATMDIASKSAEGPRETTIYGQDIYKIFSSNSYECTVEMMGDAQILPLMYFQLNGMPLWHGAYMIMEVSHSITLGNMTTTFKGLKVNRNALPMSNGATVTLNETQRDTYSSSKA